MLTPTGRALRIAWLEPSRLPYGYDDQNIYSGVLFPRAGPKMAGLLRSLGHEIEVISGETSVIDPDEIARDFDFACLSVLSNTTPHGLVLGRWLTERGMPVVMGGYQFAHQQVTPETLAPTEQALDFVPYVIRGEGYQALPQLLAALDDQLPLDKVAGLSYRAGDGRIVHNAFGPPISPEAFSDLPPADWSVIRDVNKMHVASVHGLVGCPRTCSWCAVWPRDGNGKQKSGAREMVAELMKTLELRRFRHVFFSADNFPVIHTWAKEVCDELIARGMSIPWTCQGEVPAVQREELVDLMAAAGCRRWCIGMESVNDAALQDSNKRQNRQMMEEAVRTLHDKGFHIHGMFIVGLPHDTPDTIRTTIRWAKAMKLESVQFLCLADLPGSPDYEKYKLWEHSFRPFDGALEPLNWMFVNGHYARLGNETMSYADVQDTMLEAMTTFYTWPRMLSSFVKLHPPTWRAEGRKGTPLVRRIKESHLNSIVVGLLRSRGVIEMRRWAKAPMNRAYRDLLRTQGAAFEDAKQRLLRHLPQEWLETLERVHQQRPRTAPRVVYAV